MKKLDILEDEKRGFECPGCDMYHVVNVKGDRSKGPVWGFNWNDEKPTFTPSLLVRWTSTPKELEEDENGDLVMQSDGRIKGAKDEVCHSFITDGKIRFLNDCTHKLAGKTVDLLQ